MARIVVTRPAGQETELVARLRALGHDVAHCPLIAVESLGDEPIDVEPYDWVVVTSANGARAILSAAERVLTELGTPRWAAIGRFTG